MALSRAMLKGMGLTEEQVSAVIEAHTETTEALKADRERYKAEAEKLPKVQEDLKKAQAAAKDSGELDRIKAEFEKYKADVASKEALAAKKEALKKLAEAKDGAFLSEAGVAKAVKYSDYSKIELDEKGEIKNAKELAKALREEWKEHAQIETKKGSNPPSPPPASGSDPNNGYGDIRAMTAKWHAAKYGEAPKPAADSGSKS